MDERPVIKYYFREQHKILYVIYLFLYIISLGSTIATFVFDIINRENIKNIATIGTFIGIITWGGSIFKKKIIVYNDKIEIYNDENLKETININREDILIEYKHKTLYILNKHDLNKTEHKCFFLKKDLYLFEEKGIRVDIIS